MLFNLFYVIYLRYVHLIAWQKYRSPVFQIVLNQLARRGGSKGIQFHHEKVRPWVLQIQQNNWLYEDTEKKLVYPSNTIIHL